MDEGTKVCPKCGLEKPLSDFAKSTNQKDGLHFRCRSCESIYQRQRRDAKKAAAAEAAAMHGAESETEPSESELDLEPA